MLKKIKKILKDNWQFLFVILLSFAFFLGTSCFNFNTQHYFDAKGERQEFIKWASPDESANYIFSKLYAQEGELSIAESYNLYTKDIMHPRSIRSDYGYLRPMSFLGIILIYGKIASLFSYKIIPYLTPFFAAIGIIYFYLLVKKLFNKSNAWLAAGMLAVFPPYIFYTARSMFHNVLFTVLLLMGLYYALSALASRKKYLLELKGKPYKKRCRLYFKNFLNERKNILELLSIGLAGALFGLAVITRVSELLWLLPLLILLWLFNFKKIGLWRLVIFIGFFILALVPAMHYNKMLYGAFYASGYSEMNQSLQSIAAAGTDLAQSTAQGQFFMYAQIFNKVKDVIFHFGLHPRQSWNMALIYFTQMFSWLFWTGAAGLAIFLADFKKHSKKHWIFLGLLVLISAILVLYYGSWIFNDNPDKTRHTIGNSYTRYWLPIYLGAMPFAAIFIMRLTRAIAALINKISQERGKSKDGNLNLFSKKVNCKFYFTCLRVIFLILFAYVSLAYVLYGTEEGLIFLAQRQKQSRFEFQKVLSLTESNSTIITFYHDKLFFPERKVIVGLFNDMNMNKEYANLTALLPVYYYNFTLPQKDIDYLNSRRLAEVGLQIAPLTQITSDFTLYRLSLKTEDPSLIK